MPNIGFKNKQTALALKRFADETLRAGSFGDKDATPTYLPLANQQRVLFQNKSGQDMPDGGCGWLSSNEKQDAQDRYYYEVSKQDDKWHKRYLVNLSGEVISANGYGYGSFLWATDWVLINASAGTPAEGKAWGPKEDEWKLFEGVPGFVLSGLTKGSGSTKMGRAVQRWPELFLVQALEDINEDSTGDVEILMGPPPGDESGITIEDAYNPSTDITEGGLCSLAYINEFPIVTALKCLGGTDFMAFH